MYLFNYNYFESLFSGSIFLWEKKSFLAHKAPKVDYENSHALSLAIKMPISTNDAPKKKRLKMSKSNFPLISSESLDHILNFNDNLSIVW